MSIDVELRGLSGEQQALLVQYACAARTVFLSPHDQDAQAVRDGAYNQLVEMGIYPSYSVVDDCYTHIFG